MIFLEKVNLNIKDKTDKRVEKYLREMEIKNQEKRIGCEKEMLMSE